MWFAPGRVNLIGEHTDYNDGFVLPLAIPQRVLVAAAPRNDNTLQIASLQQPGAGWQRYVAGVQWAFLQAGFPVHGADLLIDGDVPIGAGLSSSAALECAAAIALNDLYGTNCDRTELAAVARRAENDFVGVPCGPMDQLAAMHATRDHALFIDTRSLTIEPIALDLPSAGLSLLVINTNAPHSLPASDYASRRHACEQAAATLHLAALRDLDPDQLNRAMSELDDPIVRKRVRHVVTENARVQHAVRLLRQGNIEAVGPLLTESHVSLRDDYEVSSAELDAATDAALHAGALGARLTGAGFGGCAIALLPTDRAPGVTEAVARAFRDRSFSAPHCFSVIPSEGAGRLVPPA